MESKNGQMDQGMRATGSVIRLTDLASYSMQMAIYMKVNGEKTKQMEKEHIFMQMVLDIKETGEMTNSMVLVLRCGLMEHFMRVNTLKERKMDKEN
jgi:hypothetical protein